MEANTSDLSAVDATSREGNSTSDVATTQSLIDIEEPPPSPPKSNTTQEQPTPNTTFQPPESSNSNAASSESNASTSVAPEANTNTPQPSTDNFISLNNASSSSRKRSTKKKRRQKRIPTGYPDIMATDVGQVIGGMNAPMVPDVRPGNQIEADIMQIDSILKALNTGTFDQSNMATIEQLTEQRPQNLVSGVQIHPSMGLDLIGQLDDSSSSDSESDSESDSDDSDIGDNEDDNHDIDEEQTKTGKYGYPMVEGELDYRDLPPDDINVSAPQLDAPLTATGTVLHTAEQLS